MDSDKVLGIDLGTTHSCMAILEGGQPVVIVNSEGARTTPSVVAFARSDDRLVGQCAKRQSVTNPARTVQSIKRQMGSNYRVSIDGTDYSPEQISAMILQKLKTDAEAYLGETISKAVITCPAYFNHAQRQATRDAGEIAGLNVLRIINEPTACALAYGLEKAGNDEHILIYDLGGGTFDVSILQLTDGVFQVKATRGNNCLGGDDFDQRIVDWLKTQFQDINGFELPPDLTALQRLREVAETAKIELSSMNMSEIHLPFLSMDADGPVHLVTSLSRSVFHGLVADLIESTVTPVEDALCDANLTVEDIDHVVLVGGSTRIPAVQDAIKRVFQKDPVKSVNPDEAVAIGAAIQGAILAGESSDVLLLDVTPLSLGIEVAGGKVSKMIDRNTTIPTSHKKLFTTTKDEQRTIPLHILQGDNETARQNKSLARMYFDLPRKSCGVPKIEVTFEIDVDGIVHVFATDLESGLKQSMTIHRSSGLSRKEVERMALQAQEWTSKMKTNIASRQL